MQKILTPRMHANRAVQRGKARLRTHPIQFLRAFVAQQQIGTHGMARLPRKPLRQKRRLIETTTQKPQPVQGHGRDQGVLGQQGAGGLRHPAACETDDIVPVTMFERQHKPAAIIMIQQRGAPLRPRPGIGKTSITMFGPAPGLAGQGHAAGIANQTRYHRRVTPARPAQAVVAFNKTAAKRAARRVNKMDHRLNCRVSHSICSRMSRSLTDRTALMRNRRRAGDMADLFLHHAAIDEVEDRLSLVNKSFTAPLIISGFPRLWQSRFADAVHIEDDETLAAKEGAHDLVIHALCLHWADDPVGQLIQARRALMPDGLFLGVFFGGQTLHELRSALAQAESDLRGGLSPRVAPMGEIRDLGGLLQRAGFALPVADSFTLTASYGDPLRLMRDLRAMGEASALATRPRNFMRRDVLVRACELYTQIHGDSQGRIPATFEFITLTGWAPADSQPQPLRPGSAATRLAEALGTQESPLKD